MSRAEIPLQVRSRRAAWADVYLTVTLGRGRTTGESSRGEGAEVRGWIENYHKLKEHIEKISEINRELLRADRAQQRKRKRKG